MSMHRSRIMAEATHGACVAARNRHSCLVSLCTSHILPNSSIVSPSCQAKPLLLQAVPSTLTILHCARLQRSYVAGYRHHLYVPFYELALLDALTSLRQWHTLFCSSSRWPLVASARSFLSLHSSHRLPSAASRSNHRLICASGIDFCSLLRALCLATLACLRFVPACAAASCS